MYKAKIRRFFFCMLSLLTRRNWHHWKQIFLCRFIMRKISYLFRSFSERKVLFLIIFILVLSSRLQSKIPVIVFICSRKRCRMCFKRFFLYVMEFSILANVNLALSYYHVKSGEKRSSQLDRLQSHSLVLSIYVKIWLTYFI